MSKLARPKKKRQEKATPDEAEPDQPATSKRNSDNKIDTSGSTGSPGFMAGGDIHDVDVHQHFNIQKSGPQPIRVHPNLQDEFLIRIGKPIMGLLFGSPKHDMRRYGFVTLGLTLLSLLFPYYSFYQNPFTVATEGYSLLEAFSLVVVLVTAYFGPFLALKSRETKCPKCGARFSYYERDRLLTNTRRLPGRVLTNYDVTSRCDECQHFETYQDEDVEYDQPSN